MPERVLHQVIIGAAPGDAITDQAFTIRRWLRESGHASEIFAEAVHPALEKEVRPLAALRPGAAGGRLIFHHSIGSPTADWLLGLPLRLILIYHNITPPGFFAGAHPAFERQMQLGRDQLLRLRPAAELALADSAYNEAELRELGYARTGVLPITLDPRQYEFTPNPELKRHYADKGPLLLFVGRLVPNKKQDDLIKLLYYYRRVAPAARLLLVGDPWVAEYAHWLRELAAELGLGEAVLFRGHVSQPDLVTYYGLASLYVSMSEHEGFGKPLIESMLLGLPVLAYAAAAVPGTMGGAGWLFRHKHYESLAEVVDLLVGDAALRQRLIARQRAHAQQFLEPNVRRTWQRLLAAGTEREPVTVAQAPGSVEP